MKKNLFSEARWTAWQFGLLFLLLGFSILTFLGFPAFLIYPPGGLHIIRQMDSLSFVSHYFHHGMHFFEPGVYNLGQGTTGKAVSEFPLFYYITACLYHLTGEKTWLLRMLHLLTLMTGAYFLARALKNILQDVFYALCLTFLFLSSSVILYYAANYLPDIPALGFSMGGWGLFLDYLNRRNKTKLVSSVVFFTLAALIKITTLINPISVLLLVVIAHKRKSLHWSHQHHLDFKFIILLMSILLAVVAAWTVFVLSYNHLHQTRVFLTAPMPVWNLNTMERATVWDYINRFWYSKYYYETSLHVFAVIGLTGLILYRKSDKALWFNALFLLGGGLAYFILFFAQFRDHDYYFLTLVPVIIFLVLNGLVAIKGWKPVLFRHWITKSLLALLTLLSLNYGWLNLQRRFSHHDRFTETGQAFMGARAYLDQQNVPSDAKMIVIGDPTPHVSLYLMNRKGWTLENLERLNKEILDAMIQKGATHLVLVHADEAAALSAYNIHYQDIGDYNGIKIMEIIR